MSEKTSNADEEVGAEMGDLLGRAEQGDETVLPALRGLFDSRPDLWRSLSDVAGAAERALLRAAAGDNLLAAEALSRRLAVVRTELEGPSPSPQERLLAGSVALSWLHLHIAEMDAACPPDGQPDGPRACEAQHRLDRAHRRYLTAHRQLALLAKATRHLPSAYDPSMRSID